MVHNSILQVGSCNGLKHKLRKPQIQILRVYIYTHTHIVCFSWEHTIYVYIYIYWVHLPGGWDVHLRIAKLNCSIYNYSPSFRRPDQWYISTLQPGCHSNIQQPASPCHSAWDERQGQIARCRWWESLPDVVEVARIHCHGKRHTKYLKLSERESHV